MRLPRVGQRRVGRAVQISGVFSAATAVVLPFILDVAANQLATLGRWVPWAVMGGGAMLSLTLWTIGNHWAGPAPVDTPVVRPLPPVDELVGRDLTIAVVRDRATSHGLVLVHGPIGIGTSSVAIRAARELVPGETDQRYVDLRGVRPDDVGSAMLRVLRGLGLEPRGTQQSAAQRVADVLRDTGRVLLIDNVTGARQVAWVARPVPGAYIVMAGEARVDELPDAAHVPVPGLEPEDALTLLRHQGAAPPPRRLGRVLDRMLGGSRHTIDARIKADQKEAESLAAGYLQFPRMTIQIGRWLARNPQVGIAQLLHDLEGGGVVFELQKILGEMVAGASPGARRLLALLTEVPEVEYPDAAVAALADVPADRAGERLTELAERFLVYRTSSGSRISRQAARVAEPLPPRPVARARTRLVAYYAALARVNAELIGGEQFAEGVRWFAANDVTLQALLAMPSPPKRAVPHLWTIADALDVWFGRDGQRTKRRETAELMLGRARELGDTAAEAVALVRLAALERRRRNLGQARRLLGAADALGHGRVSWRPQLGTGWALWHEAARDLDAARNELLRAQRTRPQRDIEGRMTDLINLGALDIRAEAYGSAVDRLEEAARLALRAGSVGGQAHARELAGIAECAQGRIEAAETAWSDAETLYGSIGDRAGLARCSRHREIARRGPVPE